MSLVNGDKSRENRIRKQRAALRARVREMLAQQPASATSPKKQAPAAKNKQPKGSV